MINYDIPLNTHGLNANIRGNVLDVETMEINGFFVYKDFWAYMEDLGQDISLYINVSDFIDIYVIDEDFGQYYDYQAILRNNPETEIALDVHRKVQATMKRLSDSGIIEGYVANDYI